MLNNLDLFLIALVGVLGLIVVAQRGKIAELKETLRLRDETNKFFGDMIRICEKRNKQLEMQLTEFETESRHETV